MRAFRFARACVLPRLHVRLAFGRVPVPLRSREHVAFGFACMSLLRRPSAWRRRLSPCPRARQRPIVLGVPQHRLGAATSPWRHDVDPARRDAD